ncbi:MAG: VWA domain-containing protein [Pseudomonadota bacterium]
MLNSINKNRLLAASAFTLTAAFTTLPAAAASDILFILDGSGSMNARIGNVPKIDTAKDSLTDMLAKVPADARIGLMTYGTRKKKSCDDVQVVNALGADRGAIRNSIAAVTPLGKTPIERSLIKGISTLANTQPGDVRKSLVLISDGIETCNGDPCAIAATAQHRGVDLKVHVVGFNVKGKVRAQLECIAEKGGGQYFNASDTGGFKQAMAEVVKVAQAAEPAPAPEPAPEPEPVVAAPEVTEFYRDDFDGEGLSEDWTVQNENADNYIVESGELTMLSTRKGWFSNGKPENLITFNRDLPKGDWDVELTFKGEYATGADRIAMGLRRDKKNFLSATYNAYNGYHCRGYTRIILTKMSKGKKDNEENIYRAPGGSDCGHPPAGREPWEKIRADHKEKPVRMTLSKRGRAYTATVQMLGYTMKNGKPLIVTTDKFTMLRAPGTLSFQVDRFAGSGETLFQIDSLVINQVK